MPDAPGLVNEGGEKELKEGEPSTKMPKLVTQPSIPKQGSSKRMAMADVRSPSSKLRRASQGVILSNRLSTPKSASQTAPQTAPQTPPQTSGSLRASAVLEPRRTQDHLQQQQDELLNNVISQQKRMNHKLQRMQTNMNKSSQRLLNSESVASVDSNLSQRPRRPTGLTPRRRRNSMAAEQIVHLLNTHEEDEQHQEVQSTESLVVPVELLVNVSASEKMS
jgi:hypothetical protein